MAKAYYLKKVTVDEKALLGALPSPADYDVVVSGDADLFDADTKERVGCLRALPLRDCAPVLRAMKKVKFGKRKRLGANALPSTSMVFGYSPRVPLRRNYCAPCAFARENPQLNADLCSWANYCDDFLAEVAPQFHKWFTSYSSQIKPAWRINGTVFTSGYVNDTCELAYHRDLSEDPRTWNVVSIFKMGVEGGLTVLPEYRVAINAEGPSIFGFSAPKFLHGVSKINKIEPTGYRYSIIMYAMKEMVKCEEPDEELKRIQAWSTINDKKYAGGTE